jgi:F-box domain
MAVCQMISPLPSLVLIMMASLTTNMKPISFLLAEAQCILREPSARAFERKSFFLPLCKIFGVGRLCGQICGSKISSMKIQSNMPRWPHPPMTPRHPYFSVYIVENNSTTMFDVLPVELLLVILGHLSLSSYLSVSATCKSLRSHLTAPGFIDTIIKTAIASGYLRWISPVDAMRGEVNRANEIFSQWRSVYSTKNPKEPNPNSNVPNPLLLIDFPRLAFVHACFRSDSMKNRKRIWGIVKQYDALWIEYRTNGWQKDMFYTKH